VVVTGEVGTGKTLLLQCFLDCIRQKDIAFAFIFNPRLSVLEFLAYVLKDLQLSLAARTKGEMLSCLSDFLLLRCDRGATTAIIVDEAHLLDWDLLEEIRLLTNLETAKHKLIQMVLVGQPELDQKLDSPELRQLKQRVNLRCHLKPLKFEEFQGYIHRRLELAGANSHSASIFPAETIELIYELSRGIPRVVNNLCENSLISGYGRQIKQITVEIVREVAADLRLGQVALPSPSVANGTQRVEPLPGVEPNQRANQEELMLSEVLKRWRA
jgi:type II secretory pathway predicted ATPase ExeA